jgi:hypothetical protein
MLLVVLEGEPRWVRQVLPHPVVSGCSVSLVQGVPPALSFCPDYPLDFPKRQRGRNSAGCAGFGEAFEPHAVGGFG